MEYGDKVQATYTATEDDPQPRTREGVVVCPDAGSTMTEVYFGTLEEYSVYVNEGRYEVAHDLVGVFYAHELTSA